MDSASNRRVGKVARLGVFKLFGAAFSLGTFFVAVDKESASPVGANTHYLDIYVTMKENKNPKARHWIPDRNITPGFLPSALSGQLYNSCSNRSLRFSLG